MTSFCLIAILCVVVTVSGEVQKGARRHKRDVLDDTEATSVFDNEDIGWTKSNLQVDVVSEIVETNARNLNILVDHLELPVFTRSFLMWPFGLFGIYLTNGTIRNILGFGRDGDAFMAYKNNSILSKFYLKVFILQFEYNLFNWMAFDGYEKVVGSVDEIIIYAELSVSKITLKFTLHDFRIIKFRNINVQVDTSRFIALIFEKPITDLFKKHITRSFADGLKIQMQTILDDLNSELEFRNFTIRLLELLNIMKIRLVYPHL